MKPTPGIYWLIPFLIIPHQELIENIKKNSYCQANFKIDVSLILIFHEPALRR